MKLKLQKIFCLDCFLRDGKEVSFDEDVKICEKCGSTNLIEMAKIREDLF